MRKLSATAFAMPSAPARAALRRSGCFPPPPYGHLPTAAIGRLGAKAGQKNLLVRVVLRDLDKTLTSQAANALRDQIYRALHQGTEHQWAG